MALFFIGAGALLFQPDGLAAAAEDRPAVKTAGGSATDRAGLELFEKKIRPALIKYCYECHAADAGDIGGGLLLDSRHGWVAGGESGPAIEPGDPQASLLIAAIEYRDVEMPPDQRLPDEVIADFRRWVRLGAPDPREDVLPKAFSGETEEKAGAAEPLWSLQPIRRPAVPDVAPGDRSVSDIDRFVLDRLRREGLESNPLAEPETLVRRLHFDLTGLPPSPEVVDEFADDPSDQRLADLVDRLLASPEFGRRWARHWLDVARYGESAGSSRDVLMLYAWRYRDYVIDAFNRDLPYDRFVTEQVAGDLLPADDPAERKRLQIATGLLAIGSKSLNGGNLTYDIIDDQIDVVSKSVLGMTVSCARCHDHKFDPIPTADYYSLAGIFLSTDTRYGGSIRRPTTAVERRDAYLALGPPLSKEERKEVQAVAQEIERLTKEIDKTNKRVAKFRKQVPQAYQKVAKAKAAVETPPEDLPKAKQKMIHQYVEAVGKLREQEAALEAVREKLGPEPEYGLGVRDAGKIRDAPVLLRGEKNQPQDPVRRGFLSAVEGIDELTGLSGSPLSEIGDSESGRRHLAAWLVHPDNPLTPRVAVNRVWQHVMGSGLVPTVDNFGTTGQPPSHPELLDYLAHRFVHEHDWSIKSLIRELVLSRTYRLSSATEPQAERVDPDNRLRWRMPRRRLEAEALRDAMLSVSGLLRTEPLEGSLVLEIGEGEVGRGLNTSVLDRPFDYRSVYLPIIRGIVPEPLKLFDFPEPSNVQGLRDANTTPTQALYLMNSEEVVRMARQFARRLLEDPSLDSDAARIRQAHRLCFSSGPTESQLARELQFIREMSVSEGTDQSLAWTAYCQALLASAPFRYVD